MCRLRLRTGDPDISSADRCYCDRSQVQMHDTSMMYGQEKPCCSTRLDGSSGSWPEMFLALQAPGPGKSTLMLHFFNFRVNIWKTPMKNNPRALDSLRSSVLFLWETCHSFRNWFLANSKGLLNNCIPSKTYLFGIVSIAITKFLSLSSSRTFQLDPKLVTLRKGPWPGTWESSILISPTCHHIGAW